MAHDILPQFPLKLVVFPSEPLNLHIFEPRYKQLIGECRESGNTFGIPAFLNNRIMDVGTEMQLLEVVKEYPNGEMDIRTQGIGLYRIDDFIYQYTNRLYSAATITRLPNNMDADEAMRTAMVSRIKRLFRLLKIPYKYEAEETTLSVYQVGHHIGLNVEQEYQLLTLTRETERQEFVLEHLEKLLPVVGEMERLRERVQLNGHFKNISPLDFGKL